MAEYQAATSNLGTVRFIPATTLERMREDTILAEREIVAKEPSSLASYVRGYVDSHKRSKIEIENDLLALERRRNGEYEPEKLAALLDADMPEDFFRLTNKKARDVEGWLWEVYDQYGERTYDMVPMHDPEIPENIKGEIEKEVLARLMEYPEMQQMVLNAQSTGQLIDEREVNALMSTKAAEMEEEILRKAREYAERMTTNMEAEIQDFLVEGGYYTALKECINDLANYPLMVLKGPLPQKIRVIAGFTLGEDGKYKPIIEEKIIGKFFRVSPYDWFSSPTSKNAQDGPTVEIEHFRHSDIQKMIGVHGYNEKAIREILETYPQGFKEDRPIGPEQFYLQHKDSTGYDDPMAKPIDSIDFYGDVPGKILREWGMSQKDIPNETITYPVNIKMVDNIVYRAIVNPDPLAEKPYHVTSFLKSNDSQWGSAPAELGACIEDFCNNIIRNLIRNIAESAGPMAEVNEDRLAEGETPDRYPGKTFVTTSRAMTEGPAIRYYQANLMGSELYNLYKEAKLELDGIVVPSFGQGSSLTKGGGRTASGLAMIANAESRNLKVVVSNVDNDVQIPCVNKAYCFIMMYGKNEALKWPMKVRPRGVTAQLAKEGLAVRQAEFMKESLNPIDSAIIRLKGRAYLVYKRAEALGLDPNQVIPDYHKIEKMPDEPIQQIGQQGQQEAAAQGAMMPGGAKTDVSGRPMGDYNQ